MRRHLIWRLDHIAPGRAASTPESSASSGCGVCQMSSMAADASGLYSDAANLGETITPDAGASAARRQIFRGWHRQPSAMRHRFTHAATNLCCAIGQRVFASRVLLAGRKWRQSRVPPWMSANSHMTVSAMCARALKYAQAGANSATKYPEAVASDLPFPARAQVTRGLRTPRGAHARPTGCPPRSCRA